MTVRVRGGVGRRGHALKIWTLADAFPVLQLEVAVWLSAPGRAKLCSRGVRVARCCLDLVSNSSGHLC